MLYQLTEGVELSALSYYCYAVVQSGELCIGKSGTLYCYLSSPEERRWSILITDYKVARICILSGTAGSRIHATVCILAYQCLQLCGKSQIAYRCVPAVGMKQGKQLVCFRLPSAWIYRENISFSCYFVYPGYNRCANSRQTSYTRAKSTSAAAHLTCELPVDTCRLSANHCCTCIWQTGLYDTGYNLAAHIRERLVLWSEAVKNAQGWLLYKKCACSNLHAHH